ncbi:MAG: beta-glucosidase [Janthinobacterium lividum]
MRALAEPAAETLPLRSSPVQAGTGLALPSFFLGGFECSTQRQPDGRRLDLLASTGHDRLFESDFRQLQRHGVSAARDGLRWHLIESAPGQFDWSSALPMLRSARRHGLRIIWDLCHYGWPDGLDIWSGAFVERFARYAAAAARVVAEESDTPPLFCTINEISFWAWAGGETGRFAPAALGRGGELKRQLVRATIAATAAVRAAVPQARFIHAEPAIHVTSGLSDPDAVSAAEIHCQSQYEALDMMCGRQAPELGGRPDLLDVVGVNYYPDNQWYAGGSTIPLGHHAYRPLRDLLAEAHARYGRPLLISETGAEGTAKASWIHYVCGEVRAAQRAGVPIEGICLYPILDYPGWENDRPCEVGLFSMPERDGRRGTDEELADELARQQDAFAASATPGRSHGARASA